LKWLKNALSCKDVPSEGKTNVLLQLLEQTLTLKHVKDNEWQILSGDVRWLRIIVGSSGREQRHSEDMRQELEEEKTLMNVIEHHRLQWFGHVEHMSNDRLPTWPYTQ